MREEIERRGIGRERRVRGNLRKMRKKRSKGSERER